ncbi:hypothetical protein AOQ84DRAFT_373426 [Glonium stellatum]|uniref:Uncharacterized protein n=1 Tax=Glonium stellatum TaxID=574774 RepID=A0A8E2F8H5_9PEZI|nr:hypothetical protein AOQ84DRAFT_373426 [Glonium stellatum]
MGVAISTISASVAAILTPATTDGGPVMSRFLESTDSLQQIDGPPRATRNLQASSQLAATALLAAFKRIDSQSWVSEPRAKQEEEEDGGSQDQSEEEGEEEWEHEETDSID